MSNATYLGLSHRNILAHLPPFELSTQTLSIKLSWDIGFGQLSSSELVFFHLQLTIPIANDYDGDRCDTHGLVS